MIVPMLTLQEAQQHRKCRICGCSVRQPPNVKPEWQTFYDQVAIKELTVILNYGLEHSHSECLEAWKKSGGIELILSDKMAVIMNVGDIRKLIEDLPDSLPTILNFKGRMVTPVFAVETRTDLHRLFGSSALEIRDS